MSGTECPLCARSSAGPCFRSEAPLHLNHLFGEAEAARGIARAPLVIHACDACGVAWNAAFVGYAYDGAYVLDATRSARYRAHLDDVVARIASAAPVGRPLGVVEVGAGQGRFLEHLAAALGARLGWALGVDPAYRPDPTIGDVRVSMHRGDLAALDPSAMGGPVDVVVMRHLVEHQPRPVEFLSEIRAKFGDGVLVVVETPDLGHALDRGLLHDFCYEHCTLFTERGLSGALAAANVAAEGVASVFGGEYLLALGHTRSPGHRVAREADVRPLRAQLTALGEGFAPRHRALVDATEPPRVLWGAAGKGALFATWVDPDATRFEVVVDLLPTKWGHVLPGTGHPIVSPDDPRVAAAKTVFVANPTYVDEVRVRVGDARVLGVGARD